MSLTIAVQMDPIETIDISGDSTFALMLEAQRRGHQLHYYTPGALSMATAFAPPNSATSVTLSSVPASRSTTNALPRSKREVGPA